MNKAAFYEPFILEIDAGDRPYDVTTITKVHDCEDSWQVTMENSWSFQVPRLPIADGSRTLREAIEPKVGDTIEFYGKGIGYGVEGLVINGTVIFYRDQAMRDAHHRRYVEDYEARQQRRFTLQHTQLDEQYDALPSYFQQRLDRLRSEDPKFRTSSEDYELFCCAEAVKIADHIRETTPGDLETQLAALAAFRALPYEEQAAVIDNGHSGNTFAGAVALAGAYLSFEDAQSENAPA